MKKFNKSQPKMLNESRLRKIIREEIRSNEKCKHLSPQQKLMLEEGLIKKAADAIKGFFGKIFGKKGAKLSPDQQKSTLEALKAACENFISELKNIKTQSANINKEKGNLINHFSNINAQYRDFYEKYNLDDALVKKLGAALKAETDASSLFMRNLSQSPDILSTFKEGSDPVINALTGLLNVVTNELNSLPK